MQERQSRLLLPLALPTAIVAVSSSSIFIRFAQADAPSLVIAALRLVIASLLLAPLALTRHRDELLRLTRRELILGAVSGLFLAIHFAMWITSLEYTTVASSVVFVSTGPLWVALLSPVFLNEQLTRPAVVGLAIALIGGTIIGLAEACTWAGGPQCPELSQILQGQSMWGNFLALCGAWAVSGYLLIGRKARARISLIPYIFLVYGVSAVVLTIFMTTAQQNPFGYEPQTYLWIFLLAAVSQLIGHSTFNWLLKYLPATLVAVTTLSEPVGSAVLAYFFLKETPSMGVLIGGALILFGVFLTSRQSQ